jgi:RNA polymerase sigma-70 factor (ECF subfamily)
MEQHDRDDATAIAAVLAGDVDAFAILIGRYRDSFTRYAVRMLGSLEDADDALQSAFVRAFRHLHHCRDTQRFPAWLFRIVVNECRTLGMRRNERLRREKQLSAEDLGSSAFVVHEPVSRTALRDQIQRALSRLDASQREAFILKHVEDLSYEEMSHITGVGESALKMRVKRARDRLRELLEGVHHDR